MTTFGGIVDEVRLEPEENGWELIVESDHDCYRFNVHGVIASFLKMGEQAGRYIEEGQMAALAHEVELARRRADEGHDGWVEGLDGGAA